MISPGLLALAAGMGQQQDGGGSAQERRNAQPRGFAGGLGQAMGGGLGALMQGQQMAQSEQMQMLQAMGMLQGMQQRADELGLRQQQFAQQQAQYQAQQDAMSRMSQQGQDFLRTGGKIGDLVGKERKVNENGKEVTYTLNPQTLAWEKVGESPQWQPRETFSPISAEQIRQSDPQLAANLDPHLAYQRNNATGEIKPIGQAPINVNLPGAAQNQELQSGFGKQYWDVQKAGSAAQDTIAHNNQLMSLLEQVSTPGAWETSKMAIKARLKGAGIDPETFGLTDDLSAAQAAQALSRQVALSLRSPANGAGMPGSMSDQDRNYLESMVASPKMDIDTSRKIVEAQNKVAQRQIELAEMTDNYVQAHGALDPGYNKMIRQYAKDHPLFPAPDARQSERPATPAADRVLGGGGAGAPAQAAAGGPPSTARLEALANKVTSGTASHEEFAEYRALLNAARAAPQQQQVNPDAQFFGLQ